MNANALTRYTWIGYTAARSNLAYVGEVISRTIFMAVVLFIFMRLWTVVYAGRSFFETASWISRMEQAPRLHSSFMIFSSSALSFGSDTGRILLDGASLHLWSTL